MPPPNDTHVGRGRHAQGSAADPSEPVSANPAAMRTYATDAAGRTDELRTLIGEVSVALANYRQNAVLAGAGFDPQRELSWHDGWTDADGAGNSAIDALLDLCDDFDHLDAFVGSVADAVSEAEGLDDGDPEADQVYSLTAGDIADHGVGHAEREASVAEAERLAGQADDLDEMTSEERRAWIDDIEHNQNDTAFAVAFTNELGVEGLEALPDEFDLLGGDDGAFNPTATGTLSTVVDTAIGTADPDRDIPHDERIDPELLDSIRDNPDLIRPLAYAHPPDHTPNINRTVATGDAQAVTQVLEDGSIDSGLLGADFDEEDLADLAELYPPLANVLTSRPPLVHNPDYAATFANELGPENARTLTDLTNSFGLAHDRGMIRSYEGPDGQLHHEAGDRDVTISGEHDTDGPYEFYVQPFSDVMSAADRSGNLDPDVRSAVITIDAAPTDDFETMASTIQYERSNALVLHAGSFSAETTSLMADEILDSHDTRARIWSNRADANGDGGQAIEDRRDLSQYEGFTREDFLTSSERNQVLANNSWAAYNGLSDNPSAASIFYSEESNVERVQTWPEAQPYDDYYWLDGGWAIAAGRLNVDIAEDGDEVGELMHITSADSLRAGLTSDDEENRQAAMDSVVQTIGQDGNRSDADSDIFANPHLRPAIADGVAANIGHIQVETTGPDADPNDQTTSLFLEEVMRDQTAARTIRASVDEYGLTVVEDVGTSSSYDSTPLIDLGQFQTIVTDANADALRNGALDDLERTLDGDDNTFGPTPGSLLDASISLFPFGGDIYDVITDANSALAGGRVSVGGLLDWVIGKVDEQEDVDHIEELNEADRAREILEVEDGVSQNIWLTQGLAESDIPIGSLMNTDDGRTYDPEAHGYTTDTPVGDIIHDLASQQGYVDSNGTLSVEFSDNPTEAESEARDFYDWMQDDLIGDEHDPGPLHYVRGSFDINNHTELGD